MFATAAIVANATGKNADRKIRKIEDASPTPNHKIANGIHASGDRFRKKLMIGRKAIRAARRCPIHKPIGTPVATAITKPQLTRKSEVIRSLKSRPLRVSSPKPRSTASGDGKALSRKTPAFHTAVHNAMRTATTPSGRRLDFDV